MVFIVVQCSLSTLLKLFKIVDSTPHCRLLRSIIAFYQVFFQQGRVALGK